MAHDRRSAPKDTPPDIRAAKQIGFRAPADMSDRLEAIARREHNGVSAVVRRLLTVALASSPDHEAA